MILNFGKKTAAKIIAARVSAGLRAQASLGRGSLAVVGALALGTGWAARSGDFPRVLGGGVVDEDVMMAADDVVVVVEVVESEAEETDVGDGGGPRQRGRALDAGSCG